MPSVSRAATPATPPTAPPTIAPTLVPSSSSLFGADPPSAEVSDSDALVDVSEVDDELVVEGSDVVVSLSVVVLSSLVEASLLELEAVESVSEDASVVCGCVWVPMVVGSDKEMADCVRAAETLAIFTVSLPEAAVATLLASEDADPHPYWKNPPGN